MPPRRSLLILLACVLALAGCKKTPDPATSAQRFFELLRVGQAQTAYDGSAFGFQAQRSGPVFEAAAKEMGLVDFASADWGQAEVDGRTAKVPVRVQTRAGKELPLIITLTKESGAWRVYSMRSPPNESTGISENHFTLVGKSPTMTNAVNQPVPNEAELRQLVRDNLTRFNDAIASKSFDSFYDSVSLKWQDQLTKGQLQRAFQPFIDKRVDLSALRNLEPIWSAPAAVGTDGLLALSGYYATSPYRTEFSMKFIYELPTWKLFGLDVNLRR